MADREGPSSAEHGSDDVKERLVGKSIHAECFFRQAFLREQ